MRASVRVTTVTFEASLTARITINKTNKGKTFAAVRREPTLNPAISFGISSDVLERS